MAFVRKIKLKKGLSYRAEIRLAGHPSEAQTFDKMSEAHAWAERREEEIRNGIPAEGNAAKGDMYLGEATDKFLASMDGLSDNTVAVYRYAQTQILKYFGEKALMSEITTPWVSQFVTKRMKQDGVNASKIRQELTMIRAIYIKAAQWGVVLESPERVIPRPTVRKKSREDALMRVVRPDEMNALLAEAKNRRNNLYWFLLFLLHTGMRPSEAAALHWDRLPTKEENVLYNKKKHIGYVDLDRGGFSRVGTKTESRFVPGHPRAFEILTQIPRVSEYVFLPDRRTLPARNQPVDFDKQPDRPYHFFRQSMETSRARAKVDGKVIRQDIDFYSFRHTARSRMAACGIQDSAAEAIIGHADKEMQGTYTHYDDQGLIHEISKLDYPWLVW